MSKTAPLSLTCTSSCLYTSGFWVAFVAAWGVFWYIVVLRLFPDDEQSKEKKD